MVVTIRPKARLVTSMLGLDFTMPSMLGLVALAGVVVNDSILLVNSIKHYHGDTKSVAEAAPRASRSRFRDFVPWRFSDAGKHRASASNTARASEKPAQKETLAGPRRQPQFGILRCRWRELSTASTAVIRTKARSRKFSENRMSGNPPEIPL